MTKYILTVFLTIFYSSLKLDVYSYWETTKKCQKNLWLWRKSHWTDKNGKIVTIMGQISWLILAMFPGRIFFTSGRIHPKIILNQYEYNLVHQKMSSNKSLWICSKKAQLKCKARLQSFGKCIRIKAVQHNHPPTYEGNFSTLKSQIVNIEYTANRFT